MDFHMPLLCFRSTRSRIGLISKVVNFLPSGAQTVNVFIILSGFVITMVLTEKNECLKQFYIRRVCRIYPVYIISLLLAFILFPLMISDVLKVLPWGDSSSYYKDLIAKTETTWSKGWLIFCLQFLNVQGLVAHTVIPLPQVQSYQLLGVFLSSVNFMQLHRY